MATDHAEIRTDGNPPSMHFGAKTFNAFLRTETCKRAFSNADFIDRLLRSGVTIKTPTALKTFARVRYPDHYHPDSRVETTERPLGKEAMNILWSAYLAWVEEA